MPESSSPLFQRGSAARWARLALPAWLLLGGCGNVKENLGRLFVPRRVPVQFWKEWKSPHDVDIAYIVNADPSVPKGKSSLPYTIRVVFRAPNLCRIERRGVEPFVAVANAEGVRVYYPEYNLALVMPPGSSFEVSRLLDLSIGAHDPWELMKESRYLSHREIGLLAREASQLPDEQFMGRTCTVIGANYTADDKLKDSNRSGFKKLIDREFGIILGEKVSGVMEARDNREYLASELRLNEGVDPALFSLDLPKTAHVFKGVFAEGDAATLHLLSKRTWNPRAVTFRLPSDWTDSLEIMLPTYIPVGFLPLSSTAYPTNQGSTLTWKLSSTWVHPSGCSIELRQGIRAVNFPASEATQAAKQEFAIGDDSATAYLFQQPYPRAVIIWRQGGRRFMLNGAAVELEELKRFALSCRPALLETDGTIDLDTPAEAQPLVTYRLEEPRYLPAGYKLQGVYLAQDGATYIDYQAMDQPLLQLVQSGRPDAAEFFAARERPDAQQVSVKGKLGWFRETRDGAALEWCDGKRLLTLRGKLSKTELLKVAESLVPVSQAENSSVAVKQ